MHFFYKQTLLNTVVHYFTGGQVELWQDDHRPRTSL